MSSLPSAKELAARIDHTLLKAEATPKQIETLCEEGRQHRFAAICINPVYVKPAAERLAGCDTAVCSVIGFPLGSTPTVLKVAEAQRAMDDGASEIDMVVHVGALIGGEEQAVEDDIGAVAEAVHAVSADYHLKVILECGALTEAQIVTACKLAGRAGADFVKTSTGFHPSGGATLDAVRLLRANARTMRVKAAGGIRTLDDALAMIDAGADRLGTSSGVAIMEERTRRG